jgi:transcriptional regulator with XRE-family HTH domain
VVSFQHRFEYVLSIGTFAIGVGGMMDARREQVKELLKAARARIQPADVGLRRSLRQAPGLRREDVAALVGISVKWYTWLEQGRDVNFSDELLTRVAGTLRLSPSERDYLLELVRKSASHRESRAQGLTETLWRTIQLAPVPTLVMTLRWDILAWNHLTARVFRDYGRVPPQERNLLRIVLTDKRYQSDPVAYDAMVRRLVGEFRVDFGRCARDPEFQKLVGELIEIVPGFIRHWRNVEVHKEQRGSIVQHDSLGELSFDRISYVPDDSAYLRVLLFIPRDPPTAQAISGIKALALPMPDTGLVVVDEPANAVRHTNRD